MPEDHFPEDPMQFVFDCAEAAQDALCAHEGCERAMLLVLAGAKLDERTASMAYALLQCFAHFRAAALAEVRRMQQVSMG